MFVPETNGNTVPGACVKSSLDFRYVLASPLQRGSLYVYVHMHIRTQVQTYVQG